ncbi:hypothetical protein [Flavivirga eckloniae]|uniref:PNPLA domain-containing protein n=1 Tax=Flavivirga eckloniae TaxID=1803846 RepID=A0A2K9PK13_9FLAO|nr:hypothetical protein [Flavivirga eckloniae]AUP77382.1 hypothetical protein C1H87_01060 [Flavivirga eckloniae]
MTGFSKTGLNYFTNSKISKYHFRFLLGLVLIMVIIGSLCVIPGMIDSPQFTTNLSPSQVEELLIDNQSLYAYYAYFILDFIFAFLLVWIVWKLVYKFYQKSKFTRFGELCFHVFTGVAILAWVFDTIENGYYLCFEYNETIVAIKTGLYALIFLSTLIVIAYQYFQSFFPTFIGFLKSSIYSLLILAVIGVFLPRAPQVNSIVVNLYEKPLNLVFLLLMAPIYAVVLAHYPSYFNIDGKLRDWYKAKIRLGLFSTIMYKSKAKPPNSVELAKEQEKKEKPVVVGYLNFFFRLLGILFYCALFYFVGYTSEINFDWKVSISSICMALFGVGTLLLYYFRKEKNKWLDANYHYLYESLPDFYDGDYTRKQEQIIQDNGNEVQDKTLESESDENTPDADDKLMAINKWINQYLVVLLITFLAHISLFVLFYTSTPNYSCTIAVGSLICIGMQMITYVYYRTFRSVFRFTFFDEKNSVVLNAFYILRVIDVKTHVGEKKVTQEQITTYKNKITDFFDKHDFVKNNILFKFFRALSFGALSNNIVYLQVTVFIGFLNAIFILVININDSAALIFNPILIILSYLFLFYGILVGITKNFIYYNFSREKFAIRNKSRFNFLLFISFFVLFGANRLGRAYSNELFTLNLIENSSLDEHVSLMQYVDNLPNDDSTRYYIGAYGGGMKANAWTLTVLNELYEKENTFFDKTIGISGASGGTIGFINMAAIINGVKDQHKWTNSIDSISTSDILSLDITHILGRDSFNHLFVPYFDLRGYDRSTKAMNVYAELSGNCDQICKPTSYREFWKTLYEKQGKRFPVLIANSTNVLGNQGMAVSVKVDDSNLESLLYHGANNVLDIKKDGAYKTLSYYDAASTSNRFPGISPAAKIETIGHFNDGGIYENSGLLSAYKLFKAINCYEDVKDYKDLNQKNVFINIVNDKTQYIKYTVEKYVKEDPELKGIAVNETNDNTEINAILNSVASTEMMPLYIKNELQRIAEKDSLISFETIYLPHRFTVEDIKSIYGKSLDFGKGVDSTNITMHKYVIRNDDTIRTYIGKNTPIIEPPMSRMITKKAHDFMKKMLKHPTTSKAINKILGKSD